MSSKICANLSFMFQESISLLDRYSLAKQYGFNAVECAFPYDYPVTEVQNAKENANVDQILINVFPGNVSQGELGFAAIPGKQEEFRKSIDLSVTYAKALKCRRIHIMAGIVQSPNVDHDEVYKCNLQHAVNIFEKEQLLGLIEPINTYSVPNYYLNSYEKALIFIKEINSPNLKLQLDIFHLQLLKGNLTNNIKTFFPYTGHIQIAQAPNRNEPDTLGEINYSYIFQLLKDLNYSDWVGLEYKPAGDTKTGLKWLSMLK